MRIYEEIMWKNDYYLQNINNNLHNIKVLSLDIFDTLLFRTVENPQDLFIKLGNELIERKIIKETITPFEFKQIRVLAETKARNINKIKKLDEVNLRDIYNCMPNNLGDLNKVMNYEIKVEKEICYLNPSIVSLIEYANKLNIKVALVSDMYLSCEAINEILIFNGLDIDLINKLFVSNEYKKTKSSGELFKEVMNYYNVKPQFVLHIGDNEISDVYGAEKMKINYVHYEIVNCKNNYLYQMEKYKYKVILPELISLRKLAGSLYAHVDVDNQFWYKFGAEVLGPFLTLFTEWIIQTCIREGKKKIYPLMREGKIFTDLIEKSVKNRNLNIIVKPIYISRRSVFLVGIDKFDKNVLENILENKNYTIEYLFQLLELDNLEEFEKYKQIKINDIYNIMIDDKSLRKKLIEFLTNKTNIDKINENIVNGKNKFIKYMKDNFISEDDFITIDIGYRGTMQKVISNITKKINENIKVTHLLAIGEEENKYNLLDGLDIRGFIGNAGENIEIIKSITREPGPLETILTGIEKTTLRYEKKNNIIMPILGNNHLNDVEKKYIKACNEGIFTFQQLFLQCKNQLYKNYDYKKDDSGKLIARFFEYPTLEEALNIGNLHQENNFDGSGIFNFCSEKDERLLEELGIENFILHSYYNKIIWPQAIIVRKYPNYFLKNLIKESNSINDYLKIMLNLAENIKKEGYNRIKVYGAGEVGKNLIIAAKICNLKIDYIIDRNEKLWGKNIDGIEIISLDEVLEDDNSVFAIASFAYIDEIINNIVKKYNRINKEINIFSILGYSKY